MDDADLINMILERIRLLEEKMERIERALLEFLPPTNYSMIVPELLRLMRIEGGEGKKLRKAYFAKKKLAMEIAEIQHKTEIRTLASIRHEITYLEGNINNYDWRLKKGVILGGKNKGKPLPKEMLERFEAQIKTARQKIENLNILAKHRN